MFLRLFPGCAFNVLVFFSQLEIVCSDLFDTNYPILISEKAFSETEATHFGVSVALAKPPKDVEYNNKPKSWIFIGASNSSNPGSEVETPGVLWRCSLGRKTEKTSEDICEIVNIDPTPAIVEKRRQGPGNPQKEDEGNSWIGGSVEFKNDRLVTCGHKYTRGTKIFMNGICYFMLRNEIVDTETIQINSNYTHRLIPFFDPTNAFKDKEFTYTKNDNTTDIGYEFGLGEAGMSLHIADNSGVNELLVGAPGVRLWSGAIVRYRDNAKTLKPGYGRPNRDTSKPMYSEFFVAFRGTKVPGYKENNHWHDYFGYGVSAGKYFHKDKLVYAGGAPRGSDLNGQVVVFEIPSNPKGTSSEDANKWNITSLLEIPTEAARADKLGSYFGSVLLSIDVDGDGRDELLVGAPTFTLSNLRSKKTSSTFTWTGDHGCVFIYSFKMTGNEAGIDNENMVCGNEAPGARFGSAISYIRMSEDERDAKNLYIVIGAPYEDSDRGAIYIYKANDIFSKVASYSQRIAARDISPTIEGFGCSISLPEDIDENDTPDIVVGAYRSKQVVVLRTRPTIQLSQTITFKDISQSDGKLPKTAEEVKFDVCVKIVDGFGQRLTDQVLDIGTKVTVDSRLSLQANSTTTKMQNITLTSNTITFVISASTSNDKQQGCAEIVATITKSLEETKDDKAIKVTHEVWYEAVYTNDKIILEYEIEHSKGSVKANPNGEKHSFDDFKPEFPSPVEKTSVFKSLAIKANDCENKICKPELHLEADWFNPEDTEFSQPLNEYLIKNSRNTEIVLRVKISNKKETAEDPKFVIDWSKEMGNIVPSKDKTNYDFLLNTNTCKYFNIDPAKYIYNCDLPRNVIRNRTETHYFKLDLKGVFATQPERNFSIFLFVYPATNISGDRDKWKKGDGYLIKNLIVKAESNIQLIGSKDNDTLRNPFVYNCTALEFLKKQVKDGGPKMLKLYSTTRQTFSISIGGSGVSLVNMIFQLPWGKKMEGSKAIMPIVLIRPYQTAQNKEHSLTCNITEGTGCFYYIESEKQSGSETIGEGSNEIHSEVGNPEDTSGDGPSASRRRRRQAIAQDGLHTPKITKQNNMLPKETTVHLHCNEETGEFRCIEVKCDAKNVKGDSHFDVAFDMFLIQSAVDELLVDGKNELIIESKGWAEIFSGVDNKLATYMDEDVAQTRFPAVFGKIPTWVYIVAIIGGILQLVLIAFILYKCGFFKREVKEQLGKRKVEEARKSMMIRASMFPPETNDGESRQDLLEGENSTDLAQTDEPEVEIKHEGNAVEHM